uniref:Uncharacterized protein n=1 Tax=Nelumbo nucifera TaxID=4432 RepID=A0A822XUC7_NELNU|nr:TPA_asm: hypothetical protein HUJ06_026688 [Nelumbo nucifera]
MNRFTSIIPGNLFSFPITNLQLQRNLFNGLVRPWNQVRIRTVDLSYNRLAGAPATPKRSSKGLRKERWLF